jgi:hypothetical protein
LYRVCCLTELNAPTNYTTNAPFQIGRIKESVLNPKLPVQVYSLRKDEGAQIGVNLYQEPVALKTNTHNRTPESALFGITAPAVDPNYDIKSMKSGDVVITGFQRDDNGEIVLINVGMDYYVPVLTSIHKL